MAYPSWPAFQIFANSLHRHATQDGQRLTNAQVLAKANSPCLRTKQALDRLLCARKLFEIGPSPLHHLLHLEAQLDPDSWLHGVHADLQWVLQVLPNSVLRGPTMDFTEIIDYWQDPSCRWKPLLRRARNKHLLQESLMASAHMLHRKAFNLTSCGKVKLSSTQIRRLSQLRSPASTADVGGCSPPPRALQHIVASSMGSMPKNLAW